MGVAAIERPGDTKESVPEEPRGGVLGEKAPLPKEIKKREMPERTAPVPDEKIAYLGVSGAEVSTALKMHLEIETGLLLSTVDPTSPAGLSGLKENDIILTVGDKKIDGQDSLRQAILAHNPGDEVVLALLRRGKSLEQQITLGEAPAVRNIPPSALIPDRTAEMNRLMNRLPDFQLDGLGGQDLHREMMEHLQRALGDRRGSGMKQLRLELNNDGHGPGQGIQKFGSVRLEDDQGSVEMKMEGEERTVIIRDLEGKQLFKGPYTTDEDKAAVPKEYRERVERLDAGKGRMGLSLNFGGFLPRESDQEKGE